MGKTEFNEIGAIYTVEYCAKQKAVHVDFLAETILRNLRHINENKSLENNYKIIGVFEDKENASKFALKIQNYFK